MFVFEFIAANQDEFEWTPPAAGSVGFPRFRNRNADEVSQQLAERESVLMLPGTVFGHDKAFFRLGLGRRGLQVALERLQHLIRI